jgi:hypothetical protein
MDHQPGGGGDAQSYSIRDGVTNMEEFYSEGADINRFPSLDGVERS